jgi:2-oxo-4-hydroxy-4-carboxy-5-ureidoimidazoline decarboxylase
MAADQIALDAVNLMTEDAFVATFGDVAEHSPWVAANAAEARPFISRRAMSEAFLDAMFEAGAPRQLALLRAHPDLAGRAAIAGALAPESSREQSRAGLDRLTPEEFQKFTALNAAYQEKFGFPFIVAVKGIDKHGILSAFEKRLKNDPEDEFATALRQVARIVAFRLEDRVAP